MWKILQHDTPGDFVIATGEQYSVREFVTWAFDHVGRKIEWKGEGLNEIGVETATGTVRIRVDPAYYRPAEVETLLGNPTLAKEKLKWEPKASAQKLLKEMMEHDLYLAEREKHLKKGGFKN
jgi:GDPmannose 4,6-dehydratase